jgi:hypothetical protein
MSSKLLRGGASSNLLLGLVITGLPAVEAIVLAVLGKTDGVIGIA